MRQKSTVKGQNRTVADFLWEHSFLCVNIICIVFLGIYYGCHISEINTVWELPDEFGYLANTEYLVHHNWAQLTNVYYGFGYSLLLIPLFYVCGTSIQLIQGVIIVNICCILLTYIISLTLMCKLCDSISRNILAVIALILCLYPYLAANAFKITCECFLLMLIWLTWLLLYQCIETKKKVYFFFLGVVSAYIFFTHTRGIALTTTVVLILLFLGIKKQIDYKNLLVIGISLIAFFGIGFFLKRYIIAGVYTSSNVNEGGEVVNIIGLGWILTRLTWIFSSDFKLYIYAFLCKNFYLFVASLGLCHWGIFDVFSRTFDAEKKGKPLLTSEWVELSMVVAFVMMIIMVLVSGAGVLDNSAFFYYGRYYEYLLCPILFLGIRHCVIDGIKSEQYIKEFLFWGVCALGSMMLSQNLTKHSMVLDTNRIASFSLVTNEITSYMEALEYLVLYGSLGLVIVFLLCKKKRARILILIPLCFLFLKNNSVNINAITGISEGDFGDNVIANYLIEDSKDGTVFFVNSDYRHVGYYTRMQVLLGDKKLQVIELDELEEIPEGAYFVGYNSENAEDFINMTADTVMTGRAFKLYHNVGVTEGGNW